MGRKLGNKSKPFEVLYCNFNIITWSEKEKQWGTSLLVVNRSF